MMRKLFVLVTALLSITACSSNESHWLSGASTTTSPAAPTVPTTPPVVPPVTPPVVPPVTPPVEPTEEPTGIYLSYNGEILFLPNPELGQPILGAQGYKELEELDTHKNIVIWSTDESAKGYGELIVTEQNIKMHDTFYGVLATIIRTPEDLFEALSCSSIEIYNNCAYKTEPVRGVFIIANDIDMYDAGDRGLWQGYGEDKWNVVDFSGTLIGLGHTISNFTPGLSLEETSGMFGNIIDGYVTDLKIDFKYGPRGSVNNGGIAAVAKGETRINKVTVSGHYFDNIVGGNVGGIVGSLEDRSSITNSISEVYIAADDANVGGIAGNVDTFGEITNSMATGSVEGFGNSNTGGIAGAVNTNKGNNGAKIANNLFSGTIPGTLEKHVGGIIGKLDVSASGADISGNIISGVVYGGFSVVGLDDFGILPPAAENRNLTNSETADIYANDVTTVIGRDGNKYTGFDDPRVYKDLGWESWSWDIVNVNIPVTGPRLNTYISEFSGQINDILLASEGMSWMGY